MPTKPLTVIIAFLNEGVEIKRTVESVLKFAEDKVEIIVINDGSNNLYDYEEMLRPYNIVYIKNENRRGVTVCRDLGVQLAQTPYFILLDAHMRFYEKGWVDKIVSYLKEDDRRLLCCQTRALIKDESDEIVLYPDRKTSYGAYINLQREEKLLTPKWIYEKQKSPGQSIEDIPCVLGASYAASKRYWEYLKGLKGLMFYGYEEPYISMKVWMEGGRCQLIKDIEIGHIYRTSFPYRVANDEMMYNRLWIATVLLPQHWKEKIYQASRNQSEYIFTNVTSRINQLHESINELKTYYQNIFTKDFSIIEQLNLTNDYEKY